MDEAELLVQDRHDEQQRLIARIATLEAERDRLAAALAESQAQGSRPRTLCLQCGPNVAIDEDGCCAICGATATGPWLDYIGVYSDQPQPPARQLAEVETRGPVGRSTPPGELGPAPGPSGRG